MPFVPLVQGGLADRLEHVAEIATRYRSERDGRVIGTEGGRAGGRNVVSQRAGENGHSVDVAELALIGAEAQCRVPLDVFDRVIPLACRELDVRRGHVVLQVDELLGPAVARPGRWDEA